MMSLLEAGISARKQADELQRRCSSLEEARAAAEAKERAAEDAKNAAEAESMRLRAQVEKLAGAEDARKSAEAEAARLGAEVDELKAAATRREQGWPSEKRNIAIVLAASNKTAQDALAQEFPEVAAKFNIKEKGKEAALNALRTVKAGVAIPGSSGLGVTPQKQ